MVTFENRLDMLCMSSVFNCAKIIGLVQLVALSYNMTRTFLPSGLCKFAFIIYVIFFECLVFRATQKHLLNFILNISLIFLQFA